MKIGDLASIIGDKVFLKARTSSRLASASRDIVQATLVAESETAPVSTTDGAQLLESARVEDPGLGLLAKLPPFAPVAISLMRLFDHPDVEPEQVADQIGSDPALRSQLLAIANSWIYAPPAPIAEPLQAIHLIGMDHTRALSITWAMRSLHANAPKRGIVRRLWRHSLTTGLIAEQLADVYGVFRPDANSGGTIHDIGRIALLGAQSHEYEKFLLQTYDSIEQRLAEEKQQFQLNHCEAGCVLVQHWGFGPALIHAVSNHHQPVVPSDRGLTSLIHLSCQLATSMGFAAVTHAEPHNPDTTVSLNAPADLQAAILERLTVLPEQLDTAVARLDF
jgi:putative nucleotidyltransferase with HDIG domain